MNNKMYDLALSYVGTPHINSGVIKGIGLDCCTLPASYFSELCHAEFNINLDYSCDWYCKRDCEELLLPYLEKYCDRVDVLEEGTVISFRWGRAKYAHLAIYLGNDAVLHCSADNGTEITDMNSPYFYDAKGKSRITGYWRLKKWDSYLVG